MKVLINPNKEIGKLKPMHGISNGPLDGCEDLSPCYREIGVPFIRLHDTGGAANENRTLVDISRIFPNFDADENDPSNYFFHHTDELLAAIQKLGAQTIYRLGESIDHTVYNRYARPPKDFEKWSRICVNIIKHFNDGWADGHHFNILYWEIWNETEGIPKMWFGGTKEQAFDLYRVASKAIKAYDASLKVGGMAFWYYYDEEYPHPYPCEFIEFCAENSLCLDFLSYHMYTSRPEMFLENAEHCRADLLHFGFDKTEIIVDEWSYLGLEHTFDGSIWDIMGHGVVKDEEAFKLYREVYYNIKSMVGASFSLASMILMNRSEQDIATYYDGQPKNANWCGIMDVLYQIQKPFYALKAYGEVYRSGGACVKTETDGQGLYSMAAKSDSKISVLIASYRGNDGSCLLELSDLPEGDKTAEIYLLNEEYDLTIYKTLPVQGKSAKIDIPVEKYSAAYIVFSL